MITQPLGPLIVSSTNPRYFAVAQGGKRLIYLTGSHSTTLSMTDWSGRDCPDDPERFDFDAYLELLTEHGHNFIRFWRWEQFRGHLVRLMCTSA